MFIEIEEENSQSLPRLITLHEPIRKRWLEDVQIENKGMAFRIANAHSALFN